MSEYRNGYEPTQVVEADEAQQVSLGEWNPLLYSPDLARQPDIVEAIRRISSELIQQYDGQQPDFFSSYSIPSMEGPIDRIVASFHTNELSDRQMLQLEDLVRRAYRQDVRTRRRPSGSRIGASFYPEIELPDENTHRIKYNNRKLGWYLGPTLDSRIDCTDAGILVHRDVGSAAMASYLRAQTSTDWFYRGDLRQPDSARKIPNKYTIELREGRLSQAEIVQLIAQIGAILKNSEPIHDRMLLHTAYKNLYKLGLSPAFKGAVKGLDDQIAEIDRRLFLPLENPEFSKSIGLKPRSILMVGVPGTGKTLVAERFLDEDKPVFFVPISVNHLAAELSEPIEKQWLLDRLQQIAIESGLPVVLHVDDIEKIADAQGVKTAIMNLLSGMGRKSFNLLASTNKPELFDDQLMQPDRFVPVYFGLPDVEARKAILEVHVREIFSASGVNLFGSAEEKEAILAALAEETDGFTSRLLGDICNCAKGYYTYRILSELGVRKVMDKDSLGKPIKTEDWDAALEDVKKRYDVASIQRRDREVAVTTRRMTENLGFKVSTPVSRLGSTAAN